MWRVLCLYTGTLIDGPIKGCRIFCYAIRQLKGNPNAGVPTFAARPGRTAELPQPGTRRAMRHRRCRRRRKGCRMGPGLARLRRRPPGKAEGSGRRRTDVSAERGGRARKVGRPERTRKRRRESLEHRDEGGGPGKRASAKPGAPARGARDRLRQEAKNDSFLPS